MRIHCFRAPRRTETLSDLDAARERASRVRAKVQQKFTVAAMTEAVLDFYAEASFRRTRLPLRVPQASQPARLEQRR